MALRVLMVDPDVLRQRAIRRFFRVSRSDEIAWTVATSGDAAIERLESEAFDRFLIDVRLSGRVDGLAVLRHARERRIATPAVIYADALDQATSLSAQRLGACALSFDGSAREIVDALLDPPLGAYGAFAPTLEEVSFHERVRDLKLTYFAEVLRARGGKLHAAARSLHISQQAAQYLVKLLHEREERRARVTT